MILSDLNVGKIRLTVHKWKALITERHFEFQRDSKEGYNIAIGLLTVSSAVLILSVVTLLTTVCLTCISSTYLTFSRSYFLFFCLYAFSSAAMAKYFMFHVDLFLFFCPVQTSSEVQCHC